MTPTPEPTASPTPSPTTFRYTTYDTSGAVAEPGSYAFLADPADSSSVVTTYEGLRDGSARALRIHATDADGVSRAAFLDTVEAGDLFEWRQAEDCFVRYTVTELLPDPAGTPRRLLGVEWMTYAFTGCSGPIAPEAAATVDWGELPDLGGTALAAPVVHGVYQIVPEDWEGETKEKDYVPFPNYSDPVETDDTMVARTLDFWREPTIPEGWTFGKAIAAGGDAYGGAKWGYCATWWATDVKIPNTTAGHPQRGVQICADFTSTRYGNQDASWNSGSAVHETRVIAGRPASLRFSPPGPNHRPGFSTLIQVFDPMTGVTYEIEAIDYDLKSDPEAVVEMARSLFEPPNPLPPRTTFRYTTYDTTGHVAEPGSYAFLADPADSSSVVTTYEGLRGGTASALLIHTSDAAGTSRAKFYDAVEAGDLFEWRQAEDCFVRYTVTELLPDPAGTVPRKSLGVESIAYAFTGCSGAIARPASGSAANSASSSTASVTWGDLPNLGGTSLTAPIVQGPFQLVPAGWTGATKPVGPRFPAGPTIPFAETTSLAEARTFPHWREPELPEGWTFTYAWSGDEVEVGYFEAFYDGLRLTVSASGINAKYSPKEASATYTNNGSQTSVRETLQIAGRPARVHRSITDRQFGVTVHVWDEATGVLYMLQGSPDMATLIAFAHSMFEPPNPP